MTEQKTGVKYDAGKVDIAKGCTASFPRALTAVAEVSAFGARKYSWDGWTTVPNGVERYDAAGERHRIDAAKEGFIDRYTAHDEESGLLHAAHEAWNALCKLELILREMEEGPAED